jgi:hypothetical protein
LDFFPVFSDGRIRFFLHIDKDRARSRRYYHCNTEARKATNLERYHRKQAQKRAADADAKESA